MGNASREVAQASSHSSAGRRAAVVLLIVSAVVLVVLGLAAPARATTGDVGYLGPSTSGAGKPPSSDKPESKLWYAAGQWWAVMWNSGLHRYDIARLNRPAHTWVDTGVVVDTRANSLADALWDGTHLFVASHVVTVSSDTSPSPSKSGNPARLLRYTYASGSNTYTLDTGFPTQINNNSSESMTIDRDSAGRIWATWTQVASTVTGYTNTVYTNVSAAGGTRWGAPTPIPAAGASAGPDDISSVVAFGHSRVGVLWSNQRDGNFYWAVRSDSQPLGQWTVRVAVGGSHYADDHVSLKSLQSDAAGRVFAVVKTSLNDVSTTPGQPQVALLTFVPASSSWKATTAYTVGDCPTRPILVLDETDQKVKVIVTAPDSGCAFSGTPGTIFMKTASMSSPSFVTGRGTPIIKDAASANLNDATSTKQGVTRSTGLVVLATNQATKRYWFNDLPISG